MKAFLKKIKVSFNTIPQADAKISKDAFKYWDGSESSAAVRDMSHWKGEGRFEDDNVWYTIGKKHFRMVQDLCRYAKIEFDKSIKSVAEWGPGGGSNAVKFCESVERYYGIDISQSNLSECKRQLELKKFNGFRDICIDIHDPEGCLKKIDKPVDLFLSTAVYQHFPNQEYVKTVTQIAWKMLREDGIALIQTRYDDGNIGFKSKRRNYKKNFRTFTAIPLHDFWQLCYEIGLSPLCLKLQTQANYAYYFLIKRPA